MAQNQKKSMNYFSNSSMLGGANQVYLEQLYQDFLQNPASIDIKWRSLFEQISNLDNLPEIVIPRNLAMSSMANQSTNENIDSNLEHVLKHISVIKLIDDFRTFGYLSSNLDPLHLQTSENRDELSLHKYGLDEVDCGKIFDIDDFYGKQKQTLKDLVDELKDIYCNNVGFEIMHLTDAEERVWLQKNIESNFCSIELTKEQRLHILEGLVAAEGLEKYLGAKYPGAKRFGLEGCDSLIVALDSMLHTAADQNVQEIVLAMAHRGRLNVLVNILGKAPSELFDEFEGKHLVEVESGDVKYHQGFSSDVDINGKHVHLSLAFNPSHLEIVTPVMQGSVRARQERRAAEHKNSVIPISIHGDAAFAGQGVVMETLNLAHPIGYSVGGTIRVIINNQIGFTTSDVKESRSTKHCSDIGKTFLSPIIHVNAEDPERLYLVAKLAVEYRNKFNKDIIINLIGYRKHGHNEADEPSVTQPLMYKAIRQKETILSTYIKQLLSNSIFNEREIEEAKNHYKNSLLARDTAISRRMRHGVEKSPFSVDWGNYLEKNWREKVNTGISLDFLQKLANARDTVPDNFNLNSRLNKIIESRRAMTEQLQDVDWGYAETLAYASLLIDGYKIRLSGQDCERGTFFHRHVAWSDQVTGDRYYSLNNLAEEQEKFTVINSTLSEAAVLGFEYGYSTSEPRCLTIWEAQFGDFANSAQVVIDQFISSGEQKWGRLSGLVMFLPHGYEGQGPEHSSARLERYLQLCAEHNIQVCIPSTPAQVFHMLRRQMLRKMRKPLVVITPKSLLRHKLAVSKLSSLADGYFLPVIDDEISDKHAIKKVILCSGKIYYELLQYRAENSIKDTAIVRIEQLYPFPEQELEKVLDTYINADNIVWCQEEPQNQGAWYSSQHHMRSCLKRSRILFYAGRNPSAAPAAGYMQLHNERQNRVIKMAFSL